MVLYYILVPLAWLVWHIGFRIRVEGRENLKKVQTKGYILAPTHVSAIDPVFIVLCPAASCTTPRTEECTCSARCG